HKVTPSARGEVQVKNRNYSVFIRQPSYDKVERGDSMSLRGVSFEIPNEPGRVLIDILSAIEMKEYDWFLRNFDFPIQTMDGELYDSLEEFSVDQNVTGRELAKWLRGPSNYLIFAELFAFQSGQTEEVGMTYEWFQESKCHIAMLIYDCTYVDIYCKEQHVSEAFYENAVKRGYSGIKWVTDDNDPRTRLSVWSE
ncbi:DUF2691 family protein, partial [Exiguobacterium sp.]|uniref:DUF2691 family protein n=1 Tax=Exiguobacterium sp. TaxID=44751 RepID=UPI0028AF86A3